MDMKTLIMYGCYDNVEKDLMPREFHRRYKDAKSVVHYWQTEGYYWAKKSGVRRVQVTFVDEAIVEVRKHEYRTIHL